MAYLSVCLFMNFTPPAPKGTELPASSEPKHSSPQSLWNAPSTLASPLQHESEAGSPLGYRNQSLSFKIEEFIRWAEAYHQNYLCKEKWLIAAKKKITSGAHKERKDCCWLNSPLLAVAGMAAANKIYKTLDKEARGLSAYLSACQSI